MPDPEWLLEARSEGRVLGERWANPPTALPAPPTPSAEVQVVAEPFPLPVVVTITRLGGKQLDTDDNLPRSCKAVKDVLAEFLGVQDHGRDPRVKWKFRQRPAWSAGCRIRIVFAGG
jgi:hypothetical protein